MWIMIFSSESSGVTVRCFDLLLYSYSKSYRAGAVLTVLKCSCILSWASIQARCWELQGLQEPLPHEQRGLRGTVGMWSVLAVLVWGSAVTCSAVHLYDSLVCFKRKQETIKATWNMSIISCCGKLIISGHILNEMFGTGAFCFYCSP